MRILQSVCLCSTAIATLTLGATANAATTRQPPPAVARPGTDAAVRAYWTPERMLNAKPVDALAAGKPHKGHAAPSGKPQIFPGAPPRIRDYDSSLEIQLYDPSKKSGGIHPPLTGSTGQPYTTNRFYPQTAGKKLVKVFPYATIGQLFFTEPSGNYVCTASVIRLSTIATAGHCVTDGNGNYYSNWLFVPGENNGKATYGSYTWANAETTTAWYYGGGGVPNEQDDAVIVLNYRTYHRNLYPIGDFTGYLGYEFNTPAPTSITQVGYPCNLDSCTDPIATYAQNYVAGTNNFEWGTAQQGGSSGGPEIQDFGQVPSGIPSEVLGGNIVISSTSYVYNDSSIQVEGGSIFYSPGQNGEFTFGDDINWACDNGGC